MHHFTSLRTQTQVTLSSILEPEVTALTLSLPFLRKLGLKNTEDDAVRRIPSHPQKLFSYHLSFVISAFQESSIIHKGWRRGGGVFVISVPRIANDVAAKPILEGQSIKFVNRAFLPYPLLMISFVLIPIRGGTYDILSYQNVVP
jgi:hypothetical protein